MNRKSRRALAKTTPHFAPAKLDGSVSPALYAEALARHRQGRLAEAQALYRRSLVSDPGDANSLHMLGVAALQSGRDDIAVNQIDKAIRVFSAEPAYHSNRSVALLRLVGPGDALRAVDAAILLRPDYAQAYFNRGTILSAAGRSEDAAAAFGRAVTVDPILPDGQFKRGNALFDCGRSSAALASYRSAIGLDPHHAEAHCNCGNVLQQSGRPAEALVAYKAAICAKPDMDLAYVNLGIALQDDRRPADALAALRRALVLADKWEAKTAIVDCLGSCTAFPGDGDLVALMTRALREGWSRTFKVQVAALNLVRQEQTVAPLLDGSVERFADALDNLADNPLLRDLMQASPIHDFALERLLTRCRAMALASLDDVAAAMGPSAGSPEFLCALATQCFLNDYVFHSTPDEDLRSDSLRSAIEARLRAGAAISPGAIMVLACYVPLHRLENAHRLALSSWPDPVRRVIRQQVVCPGEQESMREAIPRLTGIGTGVSAAVRQQYEESPFPKWVSPLRYAQFPTVAAYVRNFLGRSPTRPLASAKPRILIAGCGTGQHPIECAFALPQAQILAIDLSLASLAYAKWKAREFGLANLEFAQADLLQLSELGREFDLIESVGVLHHLEIPEDGLRALIAALRPGGLLRLGLYSRHARKSVTATRSYIQERGYRPNNRDIRRLRQELLDLDPGDIRRAAASFADFATTSECRDLLFHVKEHQYTLPEIEAWLARYRLEFLGLQVSPHILRSFRERFPGSGDELRLDLWNRFELDHPDSFAGMYQFWVQT